MTRTALWALCAALLLACGGGSEETAPGADASAARPAPSPTSTIRVKPPTVTLAPSAQALFSATPASITVTWSVREAGGGTITAAGLYTAPASAGTYHVVASSGAASGESVVTVRSPVTVAAQDATTDACVPVQLSATVSGSSDPTVTWQLLDPTCGTLTSAGLFTSARGSGTCSVKATAHADPTATATLTVTVNVEKVLSIAVSPSSTSMLPGGTASFTAMVTTTCGTFPAGG